MRLTTLILFSVSFLPVAFAQKSEPKTGSEVIGQMHKRYQKKWYKNLTFTQQTTFYKDGKSDREETWYEAMSIPGGLAIKFGELKSGNGITFKADSQFVWRENKIVSRTRTVHELLVLGFSVYAESPDQTIAKLKEAGYDLEKLEVSTTNGKKEFVIGNPETCRFWIDSETLLFTRLQRKGKTGSMNEIQFNQYEKLGKGWIAKEVLFMRNSIVTMKEAYRDVAIPESLPSNAFSTTGLFSDITW